MNLALVTELKTCEGLSVSSFQLVLKSWGIVDVIFFGAAIEILKHQSISAGIFFFLLLI